MRAAVISLLLILPGVGHAQAVPVGRIEGFVAVMAEHGCRMSPYQADLVMPEAGYADKAETKAITEYLIGESRARILDGQLVVFGGACGGKLDYSGRERFFAALADNGCVMTIDEARVMLPDVGVEMTEVQILMDKMLRMSELRLSEDERTVVLEQGLCERFQGLSGEMKANVSGSGVDPRSAEDLRADFLAFMAKANCEMSRTLADHELPTAGFDVRALRPVIAKMIVSGEATLNAEDDTLRISEELCAR
ncbi:MAG: hypothetical protein COW54_01995 [Rhodobacteraceae bacterium CG17_big_fil_post_rev_8_21_14_2_50_63_15]|nr:hypothetical protein [Roseovarius sp.]PIV79838.1 MAG: hypothetical protein COW54_01995 [Rhodobacteraceae bacterium CG17_big_fil_post_rev_8_21_14_2_50_63_15]